MTIPDVAGRTGPGRAGPGAGRDYGLAAHRLAVTGLAGIGIATLLEVAAHMSHERVMVAVVKGAKGETQKFVTLPAVLDAVLHIRHHSERPDSHA